MGVWVWVARECTRPPTRRLSRRHQPAPPTSLPPRSTSPILRACFLLYSLRHTLISACRVVIFAFLHFAIVAAIEREGVFRCAPSTDARAHAARHVRTRASPPRLHLRHASSHLLCTRDGVQGCRVAHICAGISPTPPAHDSSPSRLFEQIVILGSNATQRHARVGCCSGSDWCRRRQRRWSQRQRWQSQSCAATLRPHALPPPCRERPHARRLPAHLLSGE